MRFDWDKEKNARNVRQRRIDFHDASVVLRNPLSQTRTDRDSPPGDPRLQTVGFGTGPILFVVHTERDGDVVRIVSARRAKPSEIRQYERGEFGEETWF